MAKATNAPAKDKALESDILNEGKAAAGNVDQGEVKQGAQDLSQGKQVQGTTESMQGQPAAGQQIAPGTQGDGSKTEPVKTTEQQAGNQSLEEKVAAANRQGIQEKQQQAKGQDQARVGNTPSYYVPQYLQENPPVDQAEMDAIAKFLQDYRAKKVLQQPRVRNVAQAPTPTHEELVKKFGPNYVHAFKGKEETYFTRIAWDRIGGSKNQDGWKAKVQAPPEVQGLNQ